MMKLILNRVDQDLKVTRLVLCASVILGARKLTLEEESELGSVAKSVIVFGNPAMAMPVDSELDFLLDVLKGELGTMVALECAEAVGSPLHIPREYITACLLADLGGDKLTSVVYASNPNSPAMPYIFSVVGDHEALCNEIAGELSDVYVGQGALTT